MFGVGGQSHFKQFVAPNGGAKKRATIGGEEDALDSLDPKGSEVVGPKPGIGGGDKENAPGAKRQRTEQGANDLNLIASGSGAGSGKQPIQLVDAPVANQGSQPAFELHDIGRNPRSSVSMFDK